MDTATRPRPHRSASVAVQRQRANPLRCLRLQRFARLAAVAAVLVSLGDGRLASSDDSAIAASAEPAFVLTVASVDRLLEDVDYLLRAGDAPQYAAFVQGFLGGLNDLQGVDRRRPLGAMLFFDAASPDAKPAPIFAIPVTDIAALQTTIAATGNRLDGSDVPGQYKLRLGMDDFQLTLLGDYALVTSPAQPVPTTAPQAVIQQLEKVSLESDLAVRFRRAGIPEILIERLLTELRADAARQQQQHDGETEEEFRIRTDIQGGLFDFMGLILTEGEELSGELTLPADAPLVASVNFRTRAGGELREWVNAVMSEPQRLIAAPNLPHGLRFQAAFDLTGRGREIARRLGSFARRKLLKEIGPKAPVDLAERINRAFDAVDATASGGHLETRFEFLTSPSGHFVLLAGLAVSQPESLDALLRTALPLAAQSGDVRGVTLDAVRLRALDFHEIIGTEVRERDRKLYGADPALFVAAGRGALWIAVGGAAAPQTLAEIFQPTETEELPSSAARLTLHVTPWAELAARSGGSREQTIAAAVRDTIQAGSAVTADLRPAPDGLSLSVRMDADYVRLLARLAVLKSRQR